MNASERSNGLASRPFLALFLVSGAVAVWAALLDVLRLTAYSGLGRLRQVQAFAVIWRDLLAPQVDLLGVLPVGFNLPFDLHTLGGFFAFLSLSMVTGVAATWSVACLLLPVVTLAIWIFPWRQDRPKSCEFWSRRYPVTLVVAAYFPQCVGSALMISRNDLVTLLLALGYAATVWWLLIRVLRPPSRLKGFLRVVIRGGAAAFLVTGTVAAGLSLLRPSPHSSIQPPAAADRPNVLLVSIDSLRSDHLHCYGYHRETSPHIDQLAAEGALFKTVVAPTSWTLPSHLTLLTALPPMQHGVVNDGLQLDNSALTLPELLWGVGYSTAGFVSGPYLDAGYGFSQGFDTYDDYTVVKPSDRLSHQGVTSPQLVALVSNWLAEWDSNGRNRPFFVFLHMWDVHYDYTPPPPYDSWFDPDYAGQLTGENVETDPAISADMEPRDLQHLIALYDGEIRYTDEHLKQILDQLNSLQVLSNTIVVITSDHGEEFFEHGQKTHRKTLYDESVLVPLIVRFPPKVAAGVVVPQQVRLAEIPSLILSLADVRQPASFGLGQELPSYAERDLAPLIAHQRSSSSRSVPAFLDLHPGTRNGSFAIRTETHKLLQFSSTDSYQLFDLTADPGEKVDLFEVKPGPAEALNFELALWKNHWRNESRFSRRIRLTRDQEERLRSLGYIK